MSSGRCGWPAYIWLSKGDHAPTLSSGGYCVQNSFQLIHIWNISVPAVWDLFDCDTRVICMYVRQCHIKILSRDVLYMKRRFSAELMVSWTPINSLLTKANISIGDSWMHDASPELPLSLLTWAVKWNKNNISLFVSEPGSKRTQIPKLYPFCVLHTRMLFDWSRNTDTPTMHSC